MKLLNLAVTCHHCRRRPRLRVTPAAIEAHRHRPREEVMLTYECHYCGERYQITAAAFQDAA